MSIIYDAIKKVEELPRPLPKKRKDRPVLILVFICAVGIIGVVLISLTKIKKTEVIPIASLSPASILPAPIVEPAPPVVEPSPAVVEPQTAVVESIPMPEETFVLNGIFFSENEGYALISDKIVKKGDSLNKAVVKSIDVDTVELELEDGSTLSLSTTR